MDLQLVLERFSVAYEISKRLSLGTTVSNMTLEINFTEQTFLDPQVANGSAPRGNLAETDYSNTTLDRRDGLIWGYSLGFMGTLIVDKLFVGGVFDFNPTFHLRSTIFLPEYKLGSQTFPAESPENTRFELSVPDTYGFGLYYRANSRLNFTFDILRREYSDLLSGNDLNVAVDDEFSEQTQTYEDADGKPDLTVEDATEIHFGLEWLFKVPKLGLIPVRFGMFTNPGHRIHAVDDDPHLQRLFPEAKDRVHLTFGIGIVGSSFYKYDIGADVSADGWQLFFSGTFTFPEY